MDNSVAELIIAIIGGPLGILASSVKFKKSIAGQRALMTSSLREEIKERDHYTCKNVRILQRKNLIYFWRLTTLYRSLREVLQVETTCKHYAGDAIEVKAQN